MRKSIFDIVKNNTDQASDVIRLESMFLREGFLRVNGDTVYTLKDYVEDYCFGTWKYRGHCLDVDDYHYTSLASLFAILQNETIRLTDYRFLNDTQELSYATHWLKALLQPMAENEFVQKLLTAIENIEQGKVERLKGIGEDLPYLQWNMCDLNYYILSLSQNYDDLAMWRMYAKDGCSIKFNSQKLKEFFYGFRDANLEKGLMNLIDGEVEYEIKESTRHAINYFYSIKNELMIYDEILMFCLLFKSPSFSFEHEYRMGIPFEDQYLGENCSKEFLLSGTTIRPQLELKNFPIRDIIEEITISPFVTSELTKIGIQELLISKGISPDVVRLSQISIR